MIPFKLIEVKLTELNPELAFSEACTKAKELLQPLHPDVKTIKLEIAYMNMDYNYLTKSKDYNYSFRILDFK